eukprot:TRINITY_DN2309_c0_g1_i1.p1 TRINITY_DN2309_c0_g1~~TRINITY_DN2309_c0_g1_i1.p1  ORF type:complete len:468 (+),score=112.33 TRINITY_DN2309_c0_g1_i1:176-1579(+)
MASELITGLEREISIPPLSSDVVRPYPVVHSFSSELKAKKSVKWGVSTERTFSCDQCPTEHIHQHEFRGGRPKEWDHCIEAMDDDRDVCSLLRDLYLPKAEEHFLLRQFLSCLEDSHVALQKISHSLKRETIVQFVSNTDQRHSRDQSGAHQLDRKRLEDVLQRLNALYHECQQHSANRNQCDCVGFVALIVQSVFEIREVTPDTVLNFLWNYYGSVHSVPYRILFLCLNGIVKKGQHEAALHVLNYYMQKEKVPSANLLEGKISEKDIPSPVLEVDQYEDLVQILVFHVLPPLYKWNEAFAFLEQDTRLPSWKLEKFRIHLSVMKEQAPAVAAISQKVEPLVARPEQKQLEERGDVAESGPKSPRSVLKHPSPQGAVLTTGTSFFRSVVNAVFTKLRNYSIFVSSTAAFAIIWMLIAMRRRTDRRLTRQSLLFGGSQSHHGKISPSALSGARLLFSSLFSLGRPSS